MFRSQSTTTDNIRADLQKKKYQPLVIFRGSGCVLPETTAEATEVYENRSSCSKVNSEVRQKMKAVKEGWIAEETARMPTKPSRHSRRHSSLSQQP